MFRIDTQLQAPSVLTRTAIQRRVEVEPNSAPSNPRIRGADFPANLPLILEPSKACTNLLEIIRHHNRAPKVNNIASRVIEYRV